MSEYALPNAYVIRVDEYYVCVYVCRGKKKKEKKIGF